MFYQLRRPPYHHPDAAVNSKHFYEFIETVGAEADRRLTPPDPAPGRGDDKRPTVLDTVWGRFLYVCGYRTPPEVPAAAGRAPNPTETLKAPAWDEPTWHGPAVTADERERRREQNRAAQSWIVARLIDQWAWHRGKCRNFFVKDMTYQFAYVALLLLVFVSGLAFDPTPDGFALTALATLSGLVLIAVPGFMAYGPINLRYYHLAESLREIHERYLGYHSEMLNVSGLFETVPAGDTETQREVLEAMSEEVERLLSSEFRFWHLVHEATTLVKSDEPRK
jgi:hypothetical protein